MPDNVTADLAGDERLTRLARQLSTAEQITHIGSWECDLRTDVVSWSDELYRIYGLEPGSEAMTRESFLSRLVPDDRPRVAAAIAAALEAPGAFTLDERIVRPDGSVRLLQSRGETRTDSAGRVVGRKCRDVTEERERDEGLRAHQDIVKNLPIGLTVWQRLPGEAGVVRLVAFNPRAEAYGMRPEMIGRTVEECFPAPGGASLASLLLEVARAGEPRSLDLVRYGDAHIHEGVFSLQIFPLPGGRVGVAVRDVGPRVRAQEALERTDATYRQLVESAQAIVWRADPRTFRFTFVSREAEVVLGYPISRWLEEPRFHAKARAVEVTLGIHDGRLALGVADDGTGLPEDAVVGAHSLGLLGMRERARRLGGDLNIRSAPGQGTVVTFSVPLEVTSVEAGR